MRRLIAIGIVGVIVAVLVAAQLALPGVAAEQLRDRLARNGRVTSVEVSAFPAIKLLWHHADSVKVRLASYASSTGGLSRLLSDASGVGTLDASAAELTTGLLKLHDATLHKQGDRLTGSARVETSDLTGALPIITDVQPVASGDGNLTLRGTASLLGVSATVDATVAAVDGRLQVAPDVPFGGLATVQVFADPHIEVQSVSATPAAGGFTATAEGTLH